MSSLARAGGFTLLELLIALAVMAILVSWTTGLGDLLDRERRFQAILELRRNLNFARSEAVTRQQRVTLCALDAQRDCDRLWRGREVAVFIDADRNRHLDDGEALRLTHWHASRGQVAWKAALGRRYLEFRPGGDTAQNGSFLYCSDSAGEDLATVITVNRAGRHYVNEDDERPCPQ